VEPIWEEFCFERTPMAWYNRRAFWLPLSKRG
jgi:hypothetical protein